MRTLCAAVALCVVFAGCDNKKELAATETAAPPPLKESPVERGQTLVVGVGCHDCHTPKKMGPNGPEPDMARILSGHPESDGPLTAFKQDPKNPWVMHTNMHLTAWSGPWGVSYAINLTPDLESGIGTWSEATFVKALQSGKHMGVARPILPPMPWMWFGKLPESDLKAIYAYLKSLPPIQNHVPPPTAPDGTAIQ